ncbi:unnamed protein product [Bursaphelenchus xylophilus]|uniref:(pine wood nematode) hypothetical protein n=1 Tax=Bursaphelenchus xylophilus TaxID=6326 RepID=A0A1I7SL25_BURXY|nr:unnamed protein product [Bursaphelenchus xylophilus]CAG9129343.1 unnamed protein product [Bursaphelenchus xylophilus]
MRIVFSRHLHTSTYYYRAAKPPESALRDIANLNKKKNETPFRDEAIEPVKKETMDYRGPKANCAVFGAGFTKTGALGFSKLVTHKEMPEMKNRPLRIGALNRRSIRRVAAGLGFSLFASPSRIYGSGLNNFYQLGGPPRSPTKFRSEVYYISPTEIQIPDRPRILSISCGRLHSLIGTSDGVYALGDNAHGQCGQDPAHFEQVTHSISDISLPRVPVPNHSPVKQVHCLLDSSFVLLENGDLYSFGLGTDGQLGTGNMDIESLPTKVNLPPIRLVGGSTDTVMAVDYDGNLFMWGQNEYNQLAEFTEEPQLCYPFQVPFKFDSPVRSAHATATSCIVSTENGTVYTWGSMILGSGPLLKESKRPIELSPNLFADARGRNSKVRRVFAGNATMAAINEANQLFVWGANRHQALALGNPKDQLFPLQVYLPTDVKSISMSPTHTLFLAETT